MKRYILAFIYIITLLGTPTAFVSAQTEKPVIGEYVVLAPLPGTTTNCTGTNAGKDCSDINSYLSGFLGLVIGIGAVIAMIMLGFYGFQYALSDSASVKMANSEKLWEILQGLLLIISAYAIIYTINPALLNFSLEITEPKITAPAVNATGTPGTLAPGGPTQPVGSRVPGCTGDMCIYGYTNSKGERIGYKNCYECNAATTYGLTIQTTSVAGINALINRDLGTRLAAIQQESNAYSAANPNTAQPQFIITETWPPTVNHLEQGQYDGTSVDLVFTNRNPTAAQIKKFIEIASRNGIRAQYEVNNEGARQELLRQGVSSTDVILVGHATGGHFSIYKKF
jgi:hypothetical protein